MAMASGLEVLVDLGLKTFSFPLQVEETGKRITAKEGRVNDAGCF